MKGRPHKKHAARLPDEQRVELRRLYVESDLTLAEIAARYAITLGAAANIARETGLPSRSFLLRARRRPAP